MMIRAWVFDLDDTLYLERDYVRSGFRAAAAWLAAEHGIDDLFDAAWRRFEAGLRGKVFDAALTDLGLPPEPGLIRRLVEIYRGHRPNLTLLPDAAVALDQLEARGVPLALLTDGPLVAQEHKVEALALQQRLAALIYTDRYGRDGWKPSPRGFRELERVLGVGGPECVYVADNPAKDFVAPHLLGWLTVRIRRLAGEHGRAVAAPGTDARHTLHSLACLPEIAPVDA